MNKQGIIIKNRVLTTFPRAEWIEESNLLKIFKNEKIKKLQQK